MKKTSQCPKCGSSKVGHLSTVQDLSDASRRLGHPVPRRIAIASETTRGWLGESENESLAGDVEAWVCTECGYFEEYVKQPAGVPWDKLEGFSWCNP